MSWSLIWNTKHTLVRQCHRGEPGQEALQAGVGARQILNQSFKIFQTKEFRRVYSSKIVVIILGLLSRIHRGACRVCETIGSIRTLKNLSIFASFAKKRKREVPLRKNRDDHHSQGGGADSPPQVQAGCWTRTQTCSTSPWSCVTATPDRRGSPRGPWCLTWTVARFGFWYLFRYLVSKGYFFQYLVSKWYLFCSKVSILLKLMETTIDYSQIPWCAWINWHERWFRKRVSGKLKWPLNS